MNNENENDTLGSIYSSISHNPIINWSYQHEKILIDWADKATCYKWLHEKAHREFAKKNRWFTIPVIIMSTFTGTANFAQDRIPPEYVNIFTMSIGTISLFAGIITTIQQFLKISELNESHRVSSISWGKFYRNIKIELAKSPMERTSVGQLIKTSKEEFDRLIETSQSIPTHVIKLFKDTFSGGEIKYDFLGNIIPLNDAQLLYKELTKPEICDALESVSKIVYKPPEIKFDQFSRNKPKKIIEENNCIQSNSIQNNSIQNNMITTIEYFIETFKNEKKRLPTTDEINDNNEESISLELIQSVLTDIESKYNLISETIYTDCEV
jgi:hypothetical protein